MDMEIRRCSPLALASGQDPVRSALCQRLRECLESSTESAHIQLGGSSGSIENGRTFKEHGLFRRNYGGDGAGYRGRMSRGGAAMVDAGESVTP